MRVNTFIRLSAVALILMLSSYASSAAGTSLPQRAVSGNTVVSEHAPRVAINVPKSARYVGTDRFVLFGIANCEIYAFVDADAAKNVRRLYWVQFEGYVPTMTRLQHTYDSARHADLGGMDFYVDTWVESAQDRAREPDLRQLEAIVRAKGYAIPAGIHSGSDEQHIDALVRAKDYKMPAAGTMSVRFVHLLDASRRKELMIIYSEDLAATGLTADELRKGGKAYARWPEIERGLIRRAEERVRVARPLDGARGGSIPHHDA